jgi:hypothetical protein
VATPAWPYSAFRRVEQTPHDRPVGQEVRDEEDADGDDARQRMEATEEVMVSLEEGPRVLGGGGVAHRVSCPWMTEQDPPPVRTIASRCRAANSGLVSPGGGLRVQVVPGARSAARGRPSTADSGPIQGVMSPNSRGRSACHARGLAPTPPIGLRIRPGLGGLDLAFLDGLGHGLGALRRRPS